LDLAASRVKLEGAKGDIDAKKRYARRTFYLVSSWIVAVFLLLVAQGFSIYGFKLSDNVLLGAIGSTTANVIEMLLIVLRHTFSLEKTKSSHQRTIRACLCVVSNLSQDRE
jgi:hypothetical protein